MRLVPWFLLCTVACIECNKEEKNSLEGVWQLVSTKPLKPDGSIDSLSPDDWQMMKIITQSHFAFVEQAPNRPKFTRGGTDEELCEAAKNFFGGGGTYTLEENTYTEHIKIFLNPSYVNVKVPFTVEFVNNDLWTQKGVLPVKELGLGDEDYPVFEVWGRVE